MSFLSFAWLILVPLVLAVAILDVMTQSPSQRIRRLSRAGLSQRAIAQRCNVSRYRVRQALAA
jgi:IS30 family transposase